MTKLRDLPEKWRKKADREDQLGLEADDDGLELATAVHLCAASLLYGCTDELEQALKEEE